MTPEFARNAGFRATEKAIVETCAMGDKSRDGVISTIESALGEAAAGKVGAPEVIEALPSALRGSAAFFRELADEIEARAAAIEATR